MRYEAQDSNQGWRVRDEQEGRYITGITEAEANIIAFALNAAVQGNALVDWDRGDYWITYDGPLP